MRVGIISNLEKPEAVVLARRLVDWLAARGVTPVIPQSLAVHLGRSCESPGGAPWMHDLTKADFITVLGGDGTLLKAARQTSTLGKPLLGVNLGRLGFLTEIEADELFDEMEVFLEGKYVVEERNMLRARVYPVPPGAAGLIPELPWRDLPARHSALALNDVVITKGTFARMILLDTYLDGSYVATYPADGLIVSTPTGSTAYSLSAGGPLVNPTLDVVIVTPICPHTFYSRPMVISKNEKLTIRVRAEGQETTLTFDGQEGYLLDPGAEEVEIALADEVARLMRKPGWNFYEVLRRKMKEGDID